MALCKDSARVKYSSHAAFDAVHKPGETVPHSGIYRCINCDDEVACNKGDPFPSQNHQQHSPPSPIRWQLLVFAVQN